MLQVVLSSVDDADVMSGDDVCWCVVFGTIISVFSVVCLDLLMMLEINAPL